MRYGSSFEYTVGGRYGQREWIKGEGKVDKTC